MKWWSITPRRPERARETPHRARPVLTHVAMAGAMSFSIPMQASEAATTLPRTSGVVIEPTTLPRTGGAVIEAWAFGMLSQATRPDATAPCDLSHVCELVISSAGGAGFGTGVTVKNSLEAPQQVQLPPNLPFTLTEIIDYPHPVSNGAPDKNGQGSCYSVTGVMKIDVGPTWTLALNIVGQACQAGPNTAQLVFTGSYAPSTASTGPYPDGIGAININNPSGLADTGINMKASLLGQLLFSP